MPHPTMIACGLSLPHRARMQITGLNKYGRKVKKMFGMGHKKDMIGSAVMQPAVMPSRTLKFR